MDISVLICTHNPDLERLQRVFTALDQQTMPKDRWECIVIDNCSEPPLSGRVDITWHPKARCVREERLGLTHARLRGIDESRGEYLVFVDDDCLLASAYLEEVFQIFCAHSFLGCVGGYGRAEYEEEPPAWMNKTLRSYHLDMYPREFGHSLQYARIQSKHSPARPIGAGLAIRKSLASSYAESIKQDPTALAFDRTGSLVLGGGDLDMGIHVVEQGFATGLSRSLRFTHVVPAFRIRLPYMLRLLYLSQYSTERLFIHRGWQEAIPPLPPEPTWKRLAKGLARWLGWQRRMPPGEQCRRALRLGSVDGLSGAPLREDYVGRSAKT